MVQIPDDAQPGDRFYIQVLSDGAFWSTVDLDYEGNTTYRSSVFSQDGYIELVP